MLAFYPGRIDQNPEKLVFQEAEKQEKNVSKQGTSRNIE